MCQDCNRMLKHSPVLERFQHWEEMEDGRGPCGPGNWLTGTHVSRKNHELQTFLRTNKVDVICMNLHTLKLSTERSFGAPWGVCRRQQPSFITLVWRCGSWFWYAEEEEEVWVGLLLFITLLLLYVYNVEK